MRTGCWRGRSKGKSSPHRVRERRVLGGHLPQVRLGAQVRLHHLRDTRRRLGRPSERERRVEDVLDAGCARSVDGALVTLRWSGR